MRTSSTARDAALKSGNPAVVGPKSLRSEILRPRLSRGFALKQTLYKLNYYDDGIIAHDVARLASKILARGNYFFACFLWKANMPLY
jgi:hypothetical protein